MDPFKQHQLIIIMSWFFGIIILLVYGSPLMFLLTALLLFLLMCFRALKIEDKKRFRFFLIVFYSFIFFLQNLFYLGAFGYLTGPEWVEVVQNLIRTFILILPLIIEYLVTVNKYTEFYFPSAQELNTISFGQLKRGLSALKGSSPNLEELRKTATIERLKELAVDFPRHSAIRYVNNGSLTDAYFSAAQASLEDEGIYIIISSTGSTVSEIISIFTRRQYNHASLSFDKDLNTIISYNGGENVYPPGLNHEMIEFFNKKADASLLVYRLPATADQKSRLIEIIREINAKGSAYNYLGLIFKTSLRPNIKFCSQFVYSLLMAVDLAYFDKPEVLVKPTDLVEMDYHRKLSFCYELLLND